MPSVEELIKQRAQSRARRRRRIILAAIVGGAALVIALSVGALALRSATQRGGNSANGAPQAQESPPPPKASAKPTATSPTTLAASASPAPSKSPSPDASAASYVIGGPAPKPRITRDFIDFNATRKAEMASYARQHYGTSDIHLDPRVIVVHYTCGSDYASTHAAFESDAPNMGVKPGVVSQFVIDKDGTVYQQIPLEYMSRHTVGLNHVAIGIEVVQECNGSDAHVVGEIMDRKAQAESLVSLVRWLMYRYDITLDNVIGHGMANDSSYYKDLKGWDNSHTDWSAPQIRLLRQKVRGAK
jgi:hypothetical protein